MSKTFIFSGASLLLIVWAIGYAFGKAKIELAKSAPDNAGLANVRNTLPDLLKQDLTMPLMYFGVVLFALGVIMAIYLFSTRLKTPKEEPVPKAEIHEHEKSNQLVEEENSKDKSEKDES